uniref:Uncharacterized protein n=1 Tax=Panagrellus redivivus TaxID=6233 RepID=A0A7E4ZQ86_PANRE
MPRRETCPTCMLKRLYQRTKPDEDVEKAAIENAPLAMPPLANRLRTLRIPKAKKTRKGPSESRKNANKELFSSHFLTTAFEQSSSLQAILSGQRVELQPAPRRPRTERHFQMGRGGYSPTSPERASCCHVA